MPTDLLKDVVPLRSLRSCPFCRHNWSYKLLDLEYALFDDSPLTSPMHLVACAGCGFTYYDTESGESNFDEFYQNHYFVQAYGTAQDYHSDSDYLRFLTDFLERNGITADSRIIDAGCGQGQLVRSLTSMGYRNVAGVELFQEYVDGLNKEGYEAHCGSVLEMPLRKGGIDLLVYKHIFEHFFDPCRAVEAAYEYLAPGGCLLVAVPDAGRYNSFPEYSPLHYLIVEHISHFDQYHLKALFESHGFRMEESVSRMLDLFEDYPVPVIYSLFRKPFESHSAERKRCADFTLAGEMVEWFAESKDLSTQELSNLQKSQQKVYVWGISYRTAMYLAMSPLKDCNIEAFLDIDPRKQQKKLFGKSIVSPDVLRGLGKEAAVVIGVGPSSRSMKKMLLDMGFEGEIIRLV